MRKLEEERDALEIGGLDWDWEARDRFGFVGRL
jgi:hypothetical protein